MRRASCQKRQTLEEFYGEAAASADSVTSAIGKAMLDLLQLLDEAFGSRRVWGLTSHYRLMLVSDEKGESERWVSITASPEEGYRIEFRVPPDEAPWPDATFGGMAKTKDEACSMVGIACEKSGAWKKNT